MPISKIFLGIVVALNGAVIAPYFHEINLKLHTHSPLSPISFYYWLLLCLFNWQNF